MEQATVLRHQWTFVCHFCRKEFHDCVEIGIHWRDEHDYNLINEGE